jgi:peptidoglycan/xylan/chitin deacetylase (PgdA/CDA1 family)
VSRRRVGGRALWAGRLEEIRRRRSVILGYHGVARSPLRQDLSRLQVRPSRFRAQIELLIEAGFKFVTVAELARLAAGREPPAGYAAVSFDDGMCSTFSVAFPALREYGICATVYVAIGFIGGVSPWIGPASDNRIMSEEELLELAATGWELGAHTMTHPDLSLLDYDACRREIEDSKTALEQISGVQCETFAYPFGSFGPASVQAARDSGFIAAVSTGGGSWDPFKLTRAMIGRLEPMPLILLKLDDRYEPLVRSPPISLVRQRSKQIRGWAQRQSAQRGARRGAG